MLSFNKPTSTTTHTWNPEKYLQQPENVFKEFRSIDERYAYNPDITGNIRLMVVLKDATTPYS